MTSILLSTIVCAAALEPLTARLESLVYLTGSFVQTDYWALTLDSESTSGTLHLAHPNLFLLEYDDVPGRATGCTGDTVFTVDPEFREILVYSGTPTGFLHILYGAEEGDVASVEENGDSLAVTVTGTFDGGIRTITAGYTISDSLPYTLSTVDANGNSTRWEIQDLTILQEAPQVFRLPDLPGYAVVEAGTI
ncbi:MAG TPA: outer membrane lipoprotein carrier protein LolA [Candidatus Sabulitectum sp.]|nr:outer membrane lipoprotein carrier protein LolA [Candidatus Sabulitectum sp.]HPF32444.1 outer membrane lipoprotein carrier protein LolA [Candidatus Sabulitectum sp.]HPJ28448.1 outer membrane lipoprotein carrier protein LolA [Candidatus Sabulitectum sp.]HPR22014.1 outer membrane lipoprotein carrier protein LolA [Candidatus Sabulitectum sp.]HRW77566.1 outer membrane lipoprotein carrier protein LolA [Candidatus Sabulitectum sp.]